MSFTPSGFRRFLILGALSALILPLGIPLFVSAANLTPAERAALEQELTNVESHIAVQRQILDVQRQQSSSLQRDVTILNAQITEAQLSKLTPTLNNQNLSHVIAI